MPPAGFEPAILAGERRQTLALDRSATGIGIYLPYTDVNGVRKRQIALDEYVFWFV